MDFTSDDVWEGFAAGVGFCFGSTKGTPKRSARFFRFSDSSPAASPAPFGCVEGAGVVDADAAVVGAEGFTEVGLVVGAGAVVYMGHQNPILYRKRETRTPTVAVACFTVVGPSGFEGVAAVVDSQSNLQEN